MRPLELAALLVGCAVSCPSLAQGLSFNGSFDRLVTSDRFETRVARVARAAADEPRRAILPYAVGGVGNSKSSTSYTAVLGGLFGCDNEAGCAAGDDPRNDVSLVYSSIDLDAGPSLDVFALAASHRLRAEPVGFRVTPFAQYTDVRSIEDEWNVGLALDRQITEKLGFTLNVAAVRATPADGPDRDDARIGAGFSYKTSRGFSIALEHELEDDVNGDESTIASIKNGFVKFSVSDSHAVRGSLVLPF